MADIKSDIKKEYAKFFEKHDWLKFKEMAEYYLREAVYLQTKDINSRL